MKLRIYNSYYAICLKIGIMGLSFMFIFMESGNKHTMKNSITSYTIFIINFRFINLVHYNEK